MTRDEWIKIVKRPTDVDGWAEELIDRLIKAGHIKVDPDPEPTFGEKIAATVSPNYGFAWETKEVAKHLDAAYETGKICGAKERVVEFELKAKAAAPHATPSEDAEAMARTIVGRRVTTSVTTSAEIKFHYWLTRSDRKALELDIANAIETGRQEGKTKLNLTDGELNLLASIRDNWISLYSNALISIAKKVLAYHL